MSLPSLISLFFFQSFARLGFSYYFSNVFQIKYMKHMGILFFHLLNLANLVLAHSLSLGSPTVTPPAAHKWGFEEVSSDHRAGVCGRCSRVPLLANKWICFSVIHSCGSSSLGVKKLSPYSTSEQFLKGPRD